MSQNEDFLMSNQNCIVSGIRPHTFWRRRCWNCIRRRSWASARPSPMDFIMILIWVWLRMAKPRTFKPDDLQWLERRMRQIIGGQHALHYREVSADEAQALFADQPYKLELIDGLAGGRWTNTAMP